MYESQTAFQVYQRLQRNDNIRIIDVREHDEWFRGHIPQANHIPLGELEQRAGELNRDQETVIVCQSGRRSGIACDYLHSLGYKVTNMSGGMSKWFWDVK